MVETTVKLSKLCKEFILQIRPRRCGDILIVSAHTFPVMNNVWKYIPLSPNDF